MPIALQPPAWDSIAATWLAIFLALLLTPATSAAGDINYRQAQNHGPLSKTSTLLGLSLTGPCILSAKSMGPSCTSSWFYPYHRGLHSPNGKGLPQNIQFAIADRPKLAAGKYTTYNYSNITWSQYGPYWKVETSPQILRNRIIQRETPPVL
ncbi:Cytochrome p450 [Arachis hypogaea]|uniref:Cytochrome p450 n=1 Tax=Arachis hypogaea TaxID=3818 RepID=A0A6B9V9C8_ARAHY|nr:Cytochrome p450 [Arachis hypogaea]